MNWVQRHTDWSKELRLMRLANSHSNHETHREIPPRVTLLHMTGGRWRFVRAFDTVARCLLRLMPKKRIISAAEPNHILVVECWSLGDLAILVPFLSNLRRSFPKARITLLGKGEYASFVDGQKFVDEFIPIRVPWTRHSNRWKKYNPFSLDWISLTRTILLLRKRQFDWAISGRMDVRDNLLLWLSDARRRIGYGDGGGACFLTDTVTPDFSRPHRTDIWLHLLTAVGGLPDRQIGEFRLTDAEIALARCFLTNRGISPQGFVIGVHPGARNATRRWGDDRFAEVVCRILEETDAHILWFSEPGTQSSPPMLERCHIVSLDFRLFLAVLRLCRLFVCNDSGPMHFANLLNVPVVAVFGPQRPEWFGPRGPQDRVVIRPEFTCRPCFDYCVYDQPYCLRTISTDDVYGAVRNQISEILQVKPLLIP